MSGAMKRDWDAIGHMSELRSRSGNCVSSDPIVSLLYTLMRDHVSTGVIEGIMMDITKCQTTYTNGWLAYYAEDIANRLRAMSP